MLQQTQTLPRFTALVEEVEQNYWRASWAESNPLKALVHHYFFQAQDVEEAHDKVFAWMRQPGHALPAHTRMVRDCWYSYLNPQQAQAISYTIPKSDLVIWRIIWQESEEKHVLLLFDPPEQADAAQRAQTWAIERRESLEQFQLLERLPGTRCLEAFFDPTIGVAFFQP